MRGAVSVGLGHQIYTRKELIKGCRRGEREKAVAFPQGRWDSKTQACPGQTSVALQICERE